MEDALATLVRDLDLLPAQADDACAVGIGLAEDVRMAQDELRVNRARNVFQPALALLLQEQGQEVDLEEEVAELVEQLRRRVRQRGVGDLVGLLDRVRDDRPRGLLPVPGAVAPKPARQLVQLDERLAERQRLYSSSVSVSPVTVAGGL